MIDALPNEVNEKLQSVKAAFNLHGIREEFVAIDEHYGCLVDAM